MLREINNIDEVLAEKIYNIWKDSVLNTHDFLLKEDFDFYKVYVKEAILNLKYILVIEEDGKIVGFLTPDFENNNINMLFISSKMINKGYGRTLIEYGIKNLNLNKVDVNEDNIKALKFYEKMGFKFKSRSSKDDFGKNYPILHMELK